MALDLPTQIGLDSDHELARAEAGQMGVALSSFADVERVFDGIPLDKVGHIFTTANCIGPIAAAWFLALAEKQGVPAARFDVQIQNDPIRSTSRGARSSCRSRRPYGSPPTCSRTSTRPRRTGCRSAFPART